MAFLFGWDLEDVVGFPAVPLGTGSVARQGVAGHVVQVLTGDGGRRVAVAVQLLVVGGRPLAVFREAPPGSQLHQPVQGAVANQRITCRQMEQQVVFRWTFNRDFITTVLLQEGRRWREADV